MKGTMKKGFAAFLAAAVLISGIPFDTLADTVESTETVVEEPEEATELEEVTETEEVAETEEPEEATESEKAETEEPTEASTEEIIETEELEELQETEEVQAEIKKSESVKATKDFYYTRELSGGLKVTLSADKGVVPDDAEVTMELIENDKLDTLKDAIKEKMQSEENPIFNWYSDVTVSVEDTYALDIKITYIDNDGMVCVYEPQENQSIRVNVEQSGLKEASEDEMREVNLFYTSDIPQSDIRYAGVQTTGKTVDIELLDNNLTVEEKGICFDANHFSVYVVSVIRYQGNASAEKIAAEQKAWNLINKYADPDYFLTDPMSWNWNMTDAQYEELRQAALQAVDGCVTEYEKIKAITAFVADRTYYDFKYYSGKSDDVFINSYDVYTQKRTVCAGYAMLMRTLLVSLEIPCMYLYGDDHAYNAAYDSENKKWIFVDATWCSYNAYTVDGQWQHKGYSYRCFDLTPEQIAELAHHEVFGFDGLLKGGVYYRLITPENAEQWVSGEWYLTMSGVKNEKITKLNCSGFENLKVLGEVRGQTFENCVLLEEVDLSQTGIKEINYGAFYNCSALRKVKFPKTLTMIGPQVFYGCSALKELDFSKTKVKEIGESAFFNCKKLKVVRLPKTVTKIGEWAFDVSSTESDALYVVTKIGKDSINAAVYGNTDNVIICAYLYKIKFDGNGATKGKMGTRQCAANEEQCLDNSYQKKGYTFAGWNTQADGKGTLYKENVRVNNLTKNADEVVTLYAQWKKTQYQITYKLDGGKNHKKNPKKYNITSNTIKLANPSKKGYVFKGWYRDKNYKKKVTAIEKGSTGKVTLYAKWAKEKYTITYKLNGGKNHKKNPKTYTVTSKTIKLANPSRKGYVFKGWYSDKKCTKKVTSIKKGSTGKITLYAKWKKK